MCPKIKNAFEPHPYKVVGKVSDVIVCIKKDHKAKPRVIHINHLLRMCREARDIEEARLIGSEEESEDGEIETAASSSEESSNLEVIDTVEIEAEPIRDIEPVLKTTRGGEGSCVTQPVILRRNENIIKPECFVNLVLGFNS